MTVLEGVTGTTITTAMLNEGDVDDSGAGLTYTITNVTDNGTMYLAGFGILGLNDTFTQADIDAGDVTYDHNDSETTSDAFSFSLADGGEDGATTATGTFSITVTLVNEIRLQRSATPMARQMRSWKTRPWERRSVSPLLPPMRTRATPSATPCLTMTAAGSRSTPAPAW